MDELTQYYGNRWSIAGYAISQFLIRTLQCYPLSLQSHYYVCDTTFEVCHALSCIKGGLFMERHNEVCDELFYLT